MNSPSYDKDLIADCIAGKRAAQYKLYNQYSKGMYSVCTRMMGDRATAQDVMQDAFVDVFKNIKSYKGESTVGAWIKRVVVNRCLTHLRKRKIQLVDAEVLEHVADDESITEDVTYEVKQIKNAMEKLPHGYKVIFSLYAVEGYDHEEIADIMGITISTSKSQYHRAKKKLKELVKL